MELDTLKDLYVDEIKDLYSAEKLLIKALPKMAKAANDDQLKQAFRTHLKETAEHAKRLEQICDELGVSPRGKKCVGMEGLIEEGEELIKENPGTPWELLAKRERFTALGLAWQPANLGQ